MAPPNSQKRVKGVQIYRPFVFGTVAKPFDPVTNPKPDGTPVDHTHSWTVFVKGVDDTDITYWLKKVQFKLHESIPNPLRSESFPRLRTSELQHRYYSLDMLTPTAGVEAVYGQPFSVSETGWGEFEISIKLHYVPESIEKPQTLWHGLRLHPYGTEEEKAKQREAGSEVRAWAYEEQIFNEPYEPFYEILTSGPPPPVGKGKGKGRQTGRLSVLNGGVGERTAMVPARGSPGQPFSRETEQLEIKRLREAQAKVDEQTRELTVELKKKEALLASLRA
jgi:YEATS domain-containing protein 4